MGKLTNKWKGLAPYFLSLLRIVSAILFIPSGTMKLFSWPMAMPPEAGPFVLMSQIGLGAVLEFFGGLLLLIGLFTRPVAFILAGMMAVAYWQFHAPGGLWPQANGGIPAILFCFIFLYLSAAGGGPLGLDAVLGKNKSGTAK